MGNFGKLNFSVAFNPTSAFPLDASSYFTSKSEAIEAASTAVEPGSSDSVHYIGKILCVVEDGVAKSYIIQPDKSLAEFISSSSGDAIVTSVAGKTGAVTLDKSDVGLNNVDNESKATMFTNPTFTGIPTAPTAELDDNSQQIANTEFVNSIVSKNLSNVANALIYKGTIGDSGTISELPNDSAKIGWSYKVITAGTYAEQKCEIGDMIICLTAGAPETPATWNVIQANTDGVITGPESAINNNVVIFDGATGKLIKDSGFTIEKSVPADAKFTDTVYTHPDEPGYKHIPSGGSEGQILVWSADGTAAWGINSAEGHYSQATSDTLGLVKIGYPGEETGNMQGASFSINIPISLNDSGQMYTTINIMTESDINKIFE